MNAAAIILAAGASSRLGSPKQLVDTGGRSLLRRTAETVCASRAREVFAVLGFDAPAMQAELQGLPLNVLVNDLWREGISSSIRRAIRSLPPGSDAALIVLCDQPRLTPGHLDALIDASERAPGRPVASGYGGSAGVPAVFPRAMFPGLLQLTGDHGAKALLRDSGAGLVTLPWPDGAYDVDTTGDVPARL